MAIFKTKEPTPEEIERRELLGAIAETRRAIELARTAFENTSEPELVDATAFEIKALEARYSYLLRLAREQGCDNFTVFKTLR